MNKFLKEIKILLSLQLSNKNNEVILSKRAIGKKEIPLKYIEDMTLLNPNAGNTSLVYLHPDGKKVRIFTRDQMKIEWLTLEYGIGMGEIVDQFTSNSHKLRDLDIYIIDMPKLEKLDSNNKKLANLITKKFQKYFHSVPINPFKKSLELRNEEIIQKITDEINEDTQDPVDQILLHIADFLSNYDNYSFDISLRNFMQTVDGKLILLDPVCNNDMVE